MTYLQFHLVFILPLLFLLGDHVRRHPPVLPAGQKASLALGLTTAIAFLYTIPWDNYLVQNNIWWYGKDRVLAVWGYVPVEEYLFFILQPLLTGFWFFVLMGRDGGGVTLFGPVETGPYGARIWGARIWGARIWGARIWGARIWGTLCWLGVTLLGWCCLQHTWGTYMGLILVWAGPVLAGMWTWKGDTFWRYRKLWAVAVAVPTVYLWIADCIAIGLGIWTISPDHTIGWHLFGLPIEEATFFLVTNILCVQGLMLFINIWTYNE